jgi:uncharacterized protein YjbJ (UPF0337 family)
MGKKSKAKHAAQVLVGKVEETAGKVVGNDKLARHGKSEQMQGKLKQAGEKVKDAFKP